MSERSVTHLETVKRKIGGEIDDLPVNKRARPSSMTTPTFHACHLTMLQSLHEKDVSTETWKQVKVFLKQRPLLLEKKKEREHLRGIHQEALKYVKHQNNSIKQPLYTTPQPLQQSPPMFSPLGMSPAGAVTCTTKPRRSLTLVARLLGTRAALEEGTAFTSLLAETNNRVQNLEVMLQKLRQERLEKDRKKMAQLLSSNNTAVNGNNTADDGAEHDHKIVEMETKIRLWRMLAHALRQVE